MRANEQQPRSNPTWMLLTLWLITATVSIFCQPFSPDIDQPHYLGIAWNMLREHHYLIPFVAGVPDLKDKPPLLYWLFIGGWKLFGVSTWWPRVVEISLAFGCIWQVGLLAKQLVHDKSITFISYCLMLSSFLWLNFAMQIRFDLLLSFFTLATLNSAYAFYHNRTLSLWVLTATCSGLAILGKGPMVFVYLIPFMLTLGRNWRWLRDCTLSVLAAFILPVAWIFLIRHAFFHGNTGTFLNQGQVYLKLSFHVFYYLQYIAVAFLPWLLMPFIWKGLLKCNWQQYRKPVTLLLAPILTALFFTCFLMSHGKGRYILSAVALLTILFAMVIQQSIEKTGNPRIAFNSITTAVAAVVGIGFLFAPIIGKHLAINFHFVTNISPYYSLILFALATMLWRNRHAALMTQLQNSCLAMLAIWCIIQVGFWIPLKPYYTPERLALAVHQLQADKHPIANTTTRLWPARLDFYGKLNLSPPYLAGDAKRQQWAAENPNGYLIVQRFINPLNPPKGLVEWTAYSILSSRYLFKQKLLAVYGLCSSRNYLSNRCQSL